MKTFYRCSNNGTIALVPERVYHEIEAGQAWYMEVQLESGGREPGVNIPLRPYPKPIFTFVDNQYLDGSTHLDQHVTGSYQLMGELVHGHCVFKREFYVPFCNSIELNPGHPLYADELNFRTTLQQAIDEFELVSATRVATVLERIKEGADVALELDQLADILPAAV